MSSPFAGGGFVDATTTASPGIEEHAAFLGGFVAAEGYFNAGPTNFRFVLALGAEDRGMCDFARDVLGCGSVAVHPRRRPHFQDEAVFVVSRLRDLVDRVVPFMDECLPPSRKRDQYGKWRSELMEYWEHRAKRRRDCTADSCEAPQRAKGLCRRHYYARYRK